MILRKPTLAFAVAITAGVVLSPPLRAAEAAPLSSTASLTDQDVQAMENKVRELHELFNRLELQAESTRSQIDRAKPQPVSFGSGELKLTNSMAWPNFNSLSGAQANLGFNFDPDPDVKGMVELELLGPVAVDRLLPQREVTLEMTNQWALLRKAEVKFENDYVLTRAFRAIPRPDMYEEGEMFYLLPAADDTEKYFRQSGRSTPNGFQFLAKDGLGLAKGFEVWAGNELTYGNTLGEVFARYKRKTGNVDYALMGLWINDPTYASGSNMVVQQEAWVRVGLWTGSSLDLAALRTPAGIGKSYTTVKTVGAGQGTMGTNALVETHTTTESDAMGVHVRLRGIKDLPLLESEEIKGEYSGIGAGNRLAALLEISLRPQRYTLLTLGGGWQQPIIGVNPTINIGTPSVNLGVVPGTGRRPFGTVGSVYDDPVRNVSNWETLWVQATLEFNPGQGWFYKYRPALVQGWNFNDRLKTPFSSAVSLRMYNHPTGTDQGIYYNASGTVVTEGPASSGKLPTNGWLYEVNDITTLAVFETTQVWAEVGLGQQIAGLSASNAVVPANAYFNSALNVRHKQLTVGVGYAEDVYGPDDWYRTFGIVIGNRYRASLVYAFARSELSIQYEGWRDKDPSKYHDPVSIVPTVGGPILVEPPIDQVMTSYTIRF